MEKKLKKKSTKTVSNTAAAKLRSKTGASITFALLLFLVCAALSAVVLVAATTASGRMSNLAQTDQRYYSVTSAACAVRDMLGNGTVTVITLQGVAAPLTFNKPLNQIKNTDIGMAVDNLADNDAAQDPKAKDTGGKMTTSTFSAYLADMCKKAVSENAVQKRTLTLSSDFSGEKDPLGVTIDAEADAAGKVTLMIYNTEGKPYKMMMVFSSKTRTGNPPVTQNEEYVITDASEVSWELSKIVSAYDAG